MAKNERFVSVGDASATSADGVKWTSSTLPPEATVQVVNRSPARDALVEAWFMETFHGRGLHVEDFNHFRRQTDALKARLAGAKE